ncbi:MAG: hypothetical protein MPK34_01465 [Gammaproteobacteria bacterium]|nr:hypothetical protein [Gammaproteobacteria bacterium]MDA7961072.1 hypothetical protein [Gammaproteobacteria bacterium]MDA8023207.1 hypothetical protein [Gammaproteobacteria bacterium]
MNDTMKILLYKIEEMVSIEDTVRDIADLAMQDRICRVSNYDMKMEELVEEKVNRTPVLLMDFCKHRDTGPGLATKNEKTKGFDLEDDQAFGEMTAILYDPKTAFVAIQYNHYGPRPGTIADYISQFQPDARVSFLPRIRDDIAREIEKKQYNSELSVTYSTAIFSESDEARNLFLDADALGNFGTHIGEVTIIVKKGRGKFAKMQNQVPFLQRIFRMNDDGNTSLKSAKVTGAMTEEDKPEVLDILSAKVFDEREGLEIDPKTQMYSFTSRCRLLRDAFAAWKSKGIITADKLQ